MSTDNQSTSPMKWYAVHTYSGLENRAKKSLEERIQQYNMQDMFGEILVPTETVDEIKAGVRKSVVRRAMPGYMLVQMLFNDGTAHLVRNTQKVTGFVGNAKNPTPLRQIEVDRMRGMVLGTVKPKARVDFTEGDSIRVTEGPFANFNGSIEEVKADKQKVRVTVSIFGRATPVELDFNQVEKLG